MARRSSPGITGLCSGVPLLHKPVMPGELRRAMSYLLSGRTLDSSFAVLPGPGG